MTVRQWKEPGTVLSCHARHRLNRGGNRQANAALYRAVLTRMSNHPETRRYVTQRRNEDRNTTEIMRSLKRYVARQVFKHLQMA